MTKHGTGDLFIHRIGHGIGLETHEHPYMVSGNSLPIKEGFAFSIEPGFYETGKSGARIEDIVICGEKSAIVLNNQPRELLVV
jgi:Xaa-Pro aminopeptidase